MRIAQLANLYESVPPKTYGGVEQDVWYITDELVKRGHDVTLFASGDSTTSAKLVSVTPKSLREMQPDHQEVYQLLAIRELIERSAEFDIIHNHMSERGVIFNGLYQAPLVTTLHGRLDVPEYELLYKKTSGAALVSISNSQRRPLPDLHYIDTVYNGIRVGDFPYSSAAGEYLAFFGRVSPEKGTHLAIEVAQKTGLPLKIVAKVDRADEAYFEEKVKPHVDGETIQYLGELSYKEKGEFLKRAKALLALIQWEEPFGLFFIEAMATGTPVIATQRGSVPEIVKDGETGFIVKSVEEAVAAVKKINSIDRKVCRAHVEEHFTVERMVDGYEAVYKKVIDEYNKSRH